MATVHFSLGSELGKRLTEIAQEKLIYNLDIDAALDTFKKSLGMPQDLAIRCLSGKDIRLVVNEEDQCIETTTEEIEGYPELDFSYFIRNWEKEHMEVYKIFERPLLDHTTYTQRYITIPVSVRNIMMGYEYSDEDPYQFLKNFVKNDMDLYLDDDSDFQKSIQDIELCRMFRDWKTLALKRAKVIDFLFANGIVGQEENLVSSRFEWTVNEYNSKLYNAIYLGIRRKTGLPVDNRDDLERYLDASKEIEEIKELLPIQDYKKHDAVWIAPDGTMYGLNGEIANMLHNTMADMLREQGVIVADNKRQERNPYVILEESGWVKVHGNWVMFEPNPFDQPKRFMSDAQVNVLKKYLDKNYGMVGTFGFQHNQIFTYRFNQMDKFAINKLFEL